MDSVRSHFFPHAPLASWTLFPSLWGTSSTTGTNKWGKIHTLMPCPFTGPKMFCACPNFLSQLKICLHLVPLQKILCWHKNQSYWIQINLDQPETFWDLYVKGQGIKGMLAFLASTYSQKKDIWLYAKWWKNMSKVFIFILWMPLFFKQPNFKSYDQTVLIWLKFLSQFREKILNYSYLKKI